MPIKIWTNTFFSPDLTCSFAWTWFTLLVCSRLSWCYFSILLELAVTHFQCKWPQRELRSQHGEVESIFGSYELSNIVWQRDGGTTSTRSEHNYARSEMYSVIIHHAVSGCFACRKIICFNLPSLQTHTEHHILFKKVLWVAPSSSPLQQLYCWKGFLLCVFPTESILDIPF